MLKRKDCELKPVRLRLMRAADGSLVDEGGTPWSWDVANAYWRAGHLITIDNQAYPPPGQTAFLGKKRGSQQ